MRIKKSDLKNYVGKKIRQSDWRNNCFITLLAIGNTGVYACDENEYESVYGGFDWETYEEPKKKVKMWQALVKNIQGDYLSTRDFYANEEAARADSLGTTFIKLLPHTEIEVEV